MGRNQKKIADRAKLFHPPSPAPENSAADNPPNIFSRVKMDCAKAYAIMGRGNHTKSLNQTKNLCLRYRNSPESGLVYRTQGDIYLDAAAHVDDRNTKQMHLKNAVESASNAVRLVPNSIEFAHYYVSLLYHSAEQRSEYEEVELECERALAIENPIDPGIDSLMDLSHHWIRTAEGRIALYQNALRSVIQKAKIGSISTWMRSLSQPLGKGEKFQVIPLKKRESTFTFRVDRSLDEAMTNSQEKDAYKTIEAAFDQQRKEANVKLAADQILQHKAESLLMADLNSTDNKTKGLDAGPVALQKPREVRKSGNVKKITSSDEKRELVLSYWNSMSSDRKKYFLRVNISDLKGYFSSPKSKWPIKVLNEALSVGKANKMGKFWICCLCDEKFANSGSLVNHVNEHMRDQFLIKKSLMPQKVKNEWALMILNCPWKPLELHDAVMMLKEKSESGAPDLVDHSCPMHDADDSEESFLDIFCNEYERNSSSGQKGSGDDSSREFEDVEWKNGDEDVLPLSKDPERAKLLEAIHAELQVLIKHKYLASSHLSKVIQYAVEALRGLEGGPQLLNSNVDQTPLCVCLLGAQELKKILKYLSEISEAVRLSERLDTDDSKSELQSVDIMEKVAFSEDFSQLVLDEHSLPCKIPHQSLNETVSVDSSAATSSHIIYANGVVLDSDALLSWILSAPATGEELADWTVERAKNIRKGQETVKLIENELKGLQRLREERIWHIFYEEKLQKVESLCSEGREEIQNEIEMTLQSYEFVLEKRKEELMVMDTSDQIDCSNKLELKIIIHVLRDARSSIFKQDDLKTCNNSDSCIEEVIQIHKDVASIEIGKVDAKIMKLIQEVQQLYVYLKTETFQDFQSILVPLMKSFLHSFLEDLAEEDAKAKCDAASEAILAELVMDSKKGVDAGVHHSKHINEKTKKKKKNKKNQKPKDKKSVEDTLLLSACDEDCPASETAVPGTDDEEALRLPEEEYNLGTEREAEERKLEKVLEYQRQIENSTNEKHLTEQWTDTQDDGWSLVKPSKGRDRGRRLVPETSEKDDCDGSQPKYGKSSPGDEVKPSKRRGRSGKKSKSVISERDDGDASQPGFQKKSPGDEDNGATTSKRSQDELTKVESQIPQNTLFFGAFLVSLKSTPVTPRAELPKISDLSVPCDGVETNVTKVNSLGTGHKNKVGEYNCFLNVIIQSLWHLQQFRDEFLRRSSEHVHVIEPCPVCALYNIFTALSTASSDDKREAVDPSSLRVALSKMYQDSNLFQEGQMNDASEVLAEIFECLHLSFTPAPVTESVDQSRGGSWDCTNASCVSHSVFGMDIFESMKCKACGLLSRCLKYTSYFHRINASDLRTWKVKCSKNSFGELLNLIQMEHQKSCNPEVRGCKTLNYISLTLSTAPDVFTAELAWQNDCESAEDIRETLAALSTVIDISELYHGLDPQNRYHLVSVVCYYGQHYNFFAYSRDHEQWVMHDDGTVKVIGKWSKVLVVCEKRRLQPHILFFEAENQ